MQAGQDVHDIFHTNVAECPTSEEAVVLGILNVLANLVKAGYNEPALFLQRNCSEVRLEVKYVNLVESLRQQFSISANTTANIEDSFTSKALHLFVNKILGPQVVSVPELFIIAH